LDIDERKHGKKHINYWTTNGEDLCWFYNNIYKHTKIEMVLEWSNYQLEAKLTKVQMTGDLFCFNIENIIQLSNLKC
jgi:hypothetical protein